MDLLSEIVLVVCVSVLQGVALFAHFRTKLAKAKQEIEQLRKQAAETSKLLAEKDLLLEQRQRTIAERTKLLEEAKGVHLATEKASVELLLTRFSVQDKLAVEADRWKIAEQALADHIEALTRAIHAGDDASLQRSQAIKCITSEVLDSYAIYLDKSVIHYRSEGQEIVASFLASEVVPFVTHLNECLEVLNAPAVLAHCATSREPLLLTSASLGSVERCLIQLLPLAAVHGWAAVATFADTNVGRRLKLPPAAVSGAASADERGLSHAG